MKFIVITTIELSVIRPVGCNLLKIREISIFIFIFYMLTRGLKQNDDDDDSDN